MEKNEIFVSGFIAGIIVGILVGGALCILIVNSN